MTWQLKANCYFNEPSLNNLIANTLLSHLIFLILQILQMTTQAQRLGYLPKVI